MPEADQPPFEPQNALEAAMVAAATVPGSEEEFRRVLHGSRVLIPQEGAAAPEDLIEEPTPRDPDEAIALPLFEVEGDFKVPVFSSMRALLLYVPEGTPYVAAAMKGLSEGWDLRHRMVINARGPVGTELSGLDVRALPGLPLPGLTTMPAKAEMLAAPLDRLDPTLEARTVSHFRTDPLVEAAYAALFRPSANEQARVAIGLQVTPEGGGLEYLEHLQKTLADDLEENVSFLVVRAEEPSALARFMLEHTRPFYVRDAAG